MSPKAKVDAAEEPKKLTGVSGWLQGVLTPLVQAAVKEAVADLHDEISADMTDMETRLLAQITQLPGLVASQVEHVALDAEQVAERVSDSVKQWFPSFLDPGQIATSVSGSVQNLLNPTAIAQQVISGVLGGLPHIPNIFGGAVHETSAGTSPEPSRPKTKAEQIREKLEERHGNK